MSVALTANPETERALRDAARRRGLAPQDLLDRIVRDYLAANDAAPGAAATLSDPTLALFDSWEADDPVSGPEDAAERQREGDAMLERLQQNRTNFEGRTDLHRILVEEGGKAAL